MGLLPKPQPLPLGLPLARVFFPMPRIPTTRTPGLCGYAQGQEKAGRPTGYGAAGGQTQLVTETSGIREESGAAGLEGHD